MDASTLVPPASGADAPARSFPACAALIAYEDLAAGQRANVMINQLAPLLGLEGPLACQMWRFDMLADAAARDAAAGEAAKADVVLVAAHHSTALPDLVKNWIWAWLQQRKAPGGTLALTFDDCVECERCKSRPESPLCKALRRAAALGWMDFVCSRSDWRRTFEECYLRRLLERARKSTSTLEGILSHRGVPRFGLND